MKPIKKLSLDIIFYRKHKILGKCPAIKHKGGIKSVILP